MNTQNNTASDSRQGVDKLKDTYLHWTKAQLVKLHGYLRLLDREVEDRPDNLVSEIYHLTHDIKGLGGSFGYYLMTDIATSLCDYVRYEESISDLNLPIIVAHITAMDVVLSEEIEESGGEQGNKIIAHLQNMIEEDKRP